MSIGMRSGDLDCLMSVASEFGLIILVRHTNEASLKYIGRRGARSYYPKPALVKAKTADIDPPAMSWKVDGRTQKLAVEVAGLVVHPAFHPGAFSGERASKARISWNDTMRMLAPDMIGIRVEREDPQSRQRWGQERQALHSPDWCWRLDVDWRSPHFACLQLKSARTGSVWCYLHGDYDLKDVIVAGQEDDNRKKVGRIDGVPNITPKLRGTAKTHGLTFRELQDLLNSRIGAPMIQHGSEAQFAWHGDEPISVIYADNSNELLIGTAEVEAWYEQRGRKVLARPPPDALAARGSAGPRLHGATVGGSPTPGSPVFRRLAGFQAT